MTILFQIFCRVCQWKNFEHRSMSGEDMGRSLVPRLSTHDVCSSLIVFANDARRCQRTARTSRTCPRCTGQSWRQASTCATPIASGGASHATTGTESGIHTRTPTRSTSVWWTCCMACRSSAGDSPSSTSESAPSRCVLARPISQRLASIQRDASSARKKVRNKRSGRQNARIEARCLFLLCACCVICVYVACVAFGGNDALELYWTVISTIRQILEEQLHAADDIKM